MSDGTVSGLVVQLGFDANIIGAKEVAKLVSGAVKVTDSYFQKKGGWVGARKDFWSLGPGKTRSTSLQSAQVIIDNSRTTPERGSRCSNPTCNGLFP